MPLYFGAETFGEQMRAEDDARRERDGERWHITRCKGCGNPYGPNPCDRKPGYCGMCAEFPQLRVKELKHD